MELRAIAQLALHLNGAAHGVHDVLGDGHAQAGALGLMHPGVILPDKGLKDPRPELRRHADAVVLDAEMDTDEVLPLLRRLLVHGDLDPPLFGGELDGVAQDVEKHLVEPQAVTADILVGDVVDGHIELLALGADLGLNDADQAVHHLPQGYLIHVQRQLAALDFAHVQHIVDEPQQMLAGQGYFFQTVLDLLDIADVGRGNRRHAHDGVHGGADIVAHIGQELAFGPAGLDGVLAGLVQLHHLLARHLQIPGKDPQQRPQHQGAGQKNHIDPLGAHLGDLLIQHAEGHDLHQIPLGVGQPRTVQMPALLADLHHGGVILAGRHGGLDPLDIFLRGALQPLEVAAQLIEIVVRPLHAAADDEGAVPADDIGVDQGVGVEGECLADVGYGQSGHQGRTSLPAFHGVVGGYAHQHQLVSCRVGAHGNLLLPVVQGLQEGLRVRHLQLAAAEHLEVAVVGVQSQILEAPGLGAVDQILHQLFAGSVGLVRLHQCLHLAQAQIDGGGKVQRDLLAHAAHVDLAYLADGIHAPTVHVDGQKGENEHRQNGYQDQAYRQKPGHLTFSLTAHPSIPPTPLGSKGENHAPADSFSARMAVTVCR